MTVQQVAVVVCIALVVFMAVLAVWGPRYLNNYMSQPSLKRPTIWFLISIEVVCLSTAMDIIETGFWPEQNMPLILPCAGGMLLLAGLGGMFVTAFKIYRLQKQTRSPFM